MFVLAFRKTGVSQAGWILLSNIVVASFAGIAVTMLETPSNDTVAVQILMLVSYSRVDPDAMTVRQPMIPGDVYTYVDNCLQCDVPI
jgi:hypothetical protein